MQNNNDSKYADSTQHMLGTHQFTSHYNTMKEIHLVSVHRLEKLRHREVKVHTVNMVDQ